jgi:all-trans-retinol 13,14-reductase
VERILPGLRAHAEVLELATPITMHAYTGNEGGALYGFSQRRGQSGPFRRFRNRGPIPGLYFASAWTFPGGGYEGAIRAGEEVARQIT